MQIAIQYEKKTLIDERYVFIPIDIIRGEYDPEDNIFISETGCEYDPINSGFLGGDYYYYNLTTIDKLKERYGKDKTEQELLYKYFDESLNNLIIGSYDIEKDCLDIVLFPYSLLDEALNDTEELTNSKKTNETDELENDEIQIAFSIETLQNLKETKSLEEVQKFIDNIITKAKQLASEEKKNEETQKNVNISKRSSMIMSLKELRQEVSKNIIGQNTAVEDVTRGIYMNMTSSNPRNKSHMLVTGPTGTGKTEIVGNVAKLLDLPYFEADATAYTKEGYVGKSVLSMLNSLIDAADGDVKAAENGILIIDEIDKKISASKIDDVSGQGVIYSLLKMMDRGIVELNDEKKHCCSKNILFDTSNLTIILMGAFEDIFDEKIKENKHKIGFSNDTIITPKRDIVLTKQDLIKGGFPIQALGRIGDVTNTNFFTIQDLERILTESQISPLKILKQYFKDELGVELETSNDYITAIATKANDLGTNARELKPLVRETIKYAFDEIIDRKDAKVLTLTKETALNNRIYKIN